MYVTWDQLLQVLLIMLEAGMLICAILALQHNKK